MNKDVHVKIKGLAIDNNKSIKVQYFDIPFSKRSLQPPQLSFQQRTSAALARIGAILKTPLLQAAALFAKGRHLTPGKHYTYSKYSIVDANIRKIISYSYYLIGLVGSILFSVPAMIGVIFELIAIKFNSNEYEITISKLDTDAKSKFNPMVLLTRNVALLPTVISNFTNLRPTSERLPEVINSIVQSPTAQDVDVLCLQEVFGKQISDKLVSELSSKFKYFIHNVAPGKVGLESGLFFASNKEIVHARYIRPPLPLITRANNFMRFTSSVESMTNKGILYVLIKNGTTYDIVINAHIKSNIGIDHIETNSIEEIRAEGLRVLAQGLFDYIDDVELLHKIKVNTVYLGADLNVSDVQENHVVTYERSGKQKGVRINTGLKDISFIFDSLFPAPAIETWLMDESRKPNLSKTGFGEENYNNPQIPLSGVCFDHAGIFTYRESKHPKNPHSTSIAFEINRFDDQGFSCGKGSPASDHAGLLLVPIQEKKRLII